MPENKSHFYEFLASVVEKDRYEEWTQSWRSWMQNHRELSWEIGFREPDMLEILVYCEDEVSLTERQFYGVSEWFFRNGFHQVTVKTFHDFV